MYTEKQLDEVKNILKQHKQEKLIKFIEKIDEDKKDILINEILRLYFEQLKNLYIGSE